MKKEKSALLKDLRDTITNAQVKISIEEEKLTHLANKSLSEVRSLSPQDQAVFFELKGLTEERLRELKHLHGSPFFVRCELLYEKDGMKKNLYFAKHQLTTEQIYSWIAPIAAIRFENPGHVSYQLPDGRIEHATLISKDQYMIVDGKVVFFSTESTDSPRVLIYQEHFSSRKNGFILPEIVEVMEKAQDAVIRAHHVGPFVISGPAGSGKTTLALHRVAYLVQSPDTAASYPKESVIVFVQDNGTKDYFSHLLPELGINNVKITTFFEWASSILNLSDIGFESQVGGIECNSDIYEHEKIAALRLDQDVSWGSDTFTTLKKYYDKSFSEESKKLFIQQKQRNVLDRIDLTVALSIYYKTYGKFETQRKYQVVAKNGGFRTKTEKNPIKYSLMVVDEFQNYMPEQLSILKNAVNSETKSIVYVGDMAQQVQLGTIHSWDEVGEVISVKRKVLLNKVYRNTKQILEYIKGLGYEVEVPAVLKEGTEVVEKIIESHEDICIYIEELANNNKEKIIGVIGREYRDIAYLKSKFSKNDLVHVCTMIESQGVEFEIVCLVGVRRDLFEIDPSIAKTDFISEKKRIHKDLLYVALTRAMEEMHILGSCYLEETIEKMK